MNDYLVPAMTKENIVTRFQDFVDLQTAAIHNTYSLGQTFPFVRDERNYIERPKPDARTSAQEQQVAPRDERTDA